MPEVSILIPVYNRAGTIEECVSSALAQSYRNIEVIISDNASSDSTWERLLAIAATDSRVRLFRNESNIGPVRNWLRCLEQATGEYIKILWSDDLLHPDFINRTLPFLQEQQEIGFVFTAVAIFQDFCNDQPVSYKIGSTGIYPALSFIKGSLLTSDYPVSPGCALFRSKDVRKNLLCDVPNSLGSDFSMHAIGNDLLLFLLTAADYTSFAYIDEPLAMFRDHAGSISATASANRLLLFYSMAKGYFIERSSVDSNLHHRFNSLLKSYLSRGFFAGSDAKRLEDFYPSGSQQRYDLFSYLKIMVRKKIFDAVQQIK